VRVKKILITGSEGFIGTHLKNYLKDKYELILFDIRLSWEMDVRNRKSIVDFIKEKKPDVIIHLAANPDIVKSVDEPSEDLRLNALGTVNVLEAAKEVKPELVIFTSTAQVYGEPQQERMNENHPIAPKSPYAIGKYTAEQYCQFYLQKFNVPSVVFRFFNIYGPGQPCSVVVPALIDKIFKAERYLEMLGSKDDSRDFVFVKDLCSAFDLAIEKKPIGEIINLGSGEETSIFELAKTIAGLLKKPIEFKYKEENIESAKISRMAGDVEKHN
jgi:UDP-glucose 4-epimerase